MRTRRERRRLALLAVTGVAAAALGVLTWATGAFQSLEVRTVDARFSIRGAQDPPSTVAVVGIDEQTLEDLELRPPFPRSLHARVIDRLRRDGAKVIAYDVQFTEETDPDEDNALIEATRRAGNVVLATSRVGPRGETDVFGGEEGVRFARATVGTTNLDSIAGRLYRFFPQENGVPSFPVAAAERATGRSVPRERFDDDGQAWIDFAGPPGTIEPVSFSRVLRGDFPRGAFRGKTVVVGSTALVLQDVASTAAGENMPGPEINANAVATVLDDFPLGPAPGWLSVLAVALMGLVTPAAAVPLRGLRWLPVAPVALAAYLLAAQAAFGGGTLLPVVPGVLALVLGLLGTLGVTYATELRDRRRLRETFARFVPAAVVDEVVAQTDDEMRLSGTRREGTVLFCDLRGFTTAAERLAAEQVIELLNRYLTEMSEAILDRGGTVVSYMGDGIMAVFGAPLEQPDHRDRAVAATREMATTRLERFNAWVREAGIGDGFRMGIGVCSGPVMSGNVGSRRRLEYAAVGDTTNTASRLEAMSKDAGHDVLIAEQTARWLSGGDHGLAYVGELPVRGRSATIKVWTLA